MWSQDTASNSVWGDHVPSLPAMPSSRDRGCPLQGRAAVTRVLPPLLGQASSRTAFQTSPCIHEADRQTLKSSHSPPPIHRVSLDFTLMGEKSRWGLVT